MTIRLFRGGPSGVVLGALLLALCLPVSAPALDAQEVGIPQTPHPEAQEAIESLRSPYCPGLMLEVCTSLGGALLRDSIQMLAEDEGWDSDQLIDWVLANHGDTLLALPRARGKSLIAWVIPPAVFLIGLGLVLVALRVMKRRAGPDDEKTTDITPEDEARLANALETLEEEEEPVF